MKPILAGVLLVSALALPIQAAELGLKVSEMTAITQFLAQHGCNPDPDLVVLFDAEMERPGFTYKGQPRVRIKDTGVIVHELWHHCQWRALKRATDGREHELLEAEARHIEMIWRKQEM